VPLASNHATEGKRGTTPHQVSAILKGLVGKQGQNGSLRRKLEQGIHRNRLFATYDDAMIEQSRRGGDKVLSEFVAREVTEEAAKLLIAARGFVELGEKVNSSQLATAAWPRVEPALRALAGLRDYDTRKRQFGGHVINCVVNAALELRGKP
jgi:hypothetical protein